MKRSDESAGKRPTDGLPTYTPSESLWERIEGELELREALEKLPHHEPPADAWRVLEVALDGKKGRSRGVAMSAAWRWAAGIAFLIGSAFLYQTLQKGGEEYLEYRTEWAPADDFPFGRAETSSAGNLIEQLCARSARICESNDFKALEEELYNLERAREEVEARMNPYGDNDELERMLMQIELQHAEIVKQMTNNLL